MVKTDIQYALNHTHVPPPFNPLPTTLSLGVVEEVLHGQIDHQGIRWTEGDIRADLWEVDWHYVPRGLKLPPMLLIWWLYSHIVQSGLGQIRSVSNVYCLILLIEYGSLKHWSKNILYHRKQLSASKQQNSQYVRMHGDMTNYKQIESCIISYLYCKQIWNDTECSYIVLIFQDNVFSTGAFEACHAVKVVHSNGQIMKWWPLLHQDVGAVVQEIEAYTLERDVVGVPI